MLPRQVTDEEAKRKERSFPLTEQELSKLDGLGKDSTRNRSPGELKVQHKCGSGCCFVLVMSFSERKSPKELIRRAILYLALNQASSCTNMERGGSIDVPLFARASSLWRASLPLSHQAAALNKRCLHASC